MPKKGRFGRKSQEPKPPRGKRAKQKEPKQPKQKQTKAGKKSSKAKFGGPGKTSPVGLDVGRTSLTAVQLKYQVGGATLLSAAIDSLPEGMVQEGEVRDTEALAFALRDFWKTNHIKGNRVALGLANQKVVVRTLEFPVLDEKELRSAIEFQAQDYIPIPIEDAVFDFHVSGRVTDENGIEKLKVLVVAAQKQMVLDFINAAKKAKLAVVGVDLQAFAMLRALAPKAALELGPAAEAVAVANIASDVTNVVVSIQGEPQFTRIISFGGDNFTRAIQQFAGVSYAEAEEFKAQIGLPPVVSRIEEERAAEAQIPEAPTMVIRPTEDEAGLTSGAGGGEPFQETGPPGPTDSGTAAGDESGFPGIPFEQKPPTEDVPSGAEPLGPPTEAPPQTSDAAERAELERILEVAADSLADELRRSLDYYMAQETSAPITRLMLSGGGALIRNLDQHLAQVFSFPVELGNPLARITQNRSDLSDEDLQALGPRLAIAIGLALEDEE